MFVGPGLLITILLLVGIFLWFHQSQRAESLADSRRGHISLLTEAVAYVGAILLLAGAGVAIGQRWEDLGDPARLGILAGATVFFVAVGFFTRRSADPAFIRLTSVVWLLATAGLAAALSQYFVGIAGTSDETSFLAVAAITTTAAASLYAMQRVVLQHLALYAGILATALAVVTRFDPDYPAWVAALTAWALGLGWMILGQRRLVPPWWVAVPIGMLTILIAPSAMQEDSAGAMFALGIGSAVGLIGFSVYGKFTPGLGLGSVGLLGYVTGAVVRYFGDTLGVPVALALTGGLILVLAAFTTRLVRFTRTPPAEPDTGEPPATLRKAS